MGIQESLKFWPKLKATVEKVCKDFDVEWQSRVHLKLGSILDLCGLQLKPLKL